MKNITLLVSAASTIFGTFVSAQPMTVPVAAPTPTPVAAPCPCPQAFQGFHLGGNVGYGVGGSRINRMLPARPTVTLNRDIRVSGFDGGLNVGYTHRFGNIGLGIEGVFNWSTTNGSEKVTDATGTILSEKARLNNSIQLRGNISYIICNLISPKIILGWDNSEWTRNLSLNLNNSSGVLKDRKRYNGFLWGAGVDFLLAKDIIAGIEYTGVLSSKKSATVGALGFSDTTSFRPQYNKFALVVKFIY